MTIEYIVGDCLKQSHHSDCKIIPHCCNDIGVMGAGVAAAISNKYPNAKKHYVDFYNRCKQNNKPFIGKLQIVHVEPTVFIANMIGQRGVAVNKENGIYVGNDGIPPIRYDKLFRSMDLMFKYLNESTHTWEIHCPKFGSELSGGSWDIIEKHIEETWATKYLVKVCTLK